MKSKKFEKANNPDTIIHSNKVLKSCNFISNIVHDFRIKCKPCTNILLVTSYSPLNELWTIGILEDEISKNFLQTSFLRQTSQFKNPVNSVESNVNLLNSPQLYVMIAKQVNYHSFLLSKSSLLLIACSWSFVHLLTSYKLQYTIHLKK